MKVLLFSHKSDIDGLGSVILGSVAFSDFTYELFEDVNDLEIKFRNYINLNYFDKFDRVFITDLALYEPSLSMVASSELSKKVLVFDHHQAAINKGYGNYDFTTIHEVLDGKIKCGTELFYEYLVNNNLINCNKCSDYFVEYTRLEDTWEWINNKEIGIKAHDLSILYNALGREKYISAIIYKLKNDDNFFYSELEEKLINEKKEEYEKKLSEIVDDAEYLTDSNGNNFAVMFCDYQYRNELPDFISNHGNSHNVKYIIIVAYDKGEYGQKSYRRVDTNFNVNDVAQAHGGGGHPGSAAVGITKEQRDSALSMSKTDAAKYLADAIYRK